MQFLLVALNAKYIHSNPALYSLRGFVNREYQKQVTIAEYTINNQFEEILADIYRRNPDVVAFSCYIWNWTMIQEIIVELHKILPNLPIWLGGPEVSFDADKILQKYPMITGVMLGEGEETFAELLGVYQKKQNNFKEIAGLCIRAGEEIVKTMPRSLTNLSDMPFLYAKLDNFTNRILYYETSRGCPYRCSYCLSSIDKSVRLRDLSIVKKELQYFLDAKVAQVKFVDRTFNCNHQHAQEIWRYITEHDNGITNFHFEIAADIITKEEIELLNAMRPGLAQLEIGVQSTNEQTLDVIHRFVRLSHLKEVVSAIRQGENVHIHLDLIAGLPFEDYASFCKSFNEVYAMQPEQLQLGFLKVLKGSEIHERADEYGIVYMEKPPYEVLYTKWLSFGEVLRLKQIEEMVEIYYNSNQFVHTLQELVMHFDTPFAMFAQLADFYETNGYFVNSPARAYRYQVLLQFAQSLPQADLELYQELLTYDLYLRENVKSRPEYAADLSPYKEEMVDFYRREEMNRVYLTGYEEYSAKQLMKMTHLERFTYPVWEEDSTLRSKRANKPGYMLFDYQKRSPLTADATTYVVL